MQEEVENRSVNLAITTTKVIRKYDEYMTLLNDVNQPELTMDVFHEFRIHTLKELGWYLEKNAEYGGYVKVSWSNKLMLIPFHNDFMNSWLRFDNPRVKEFYNNLLKLPTPIRCVEP